MRQSLEQIRSDFQTLLQENAMLRSQKEELEKKVQELDDLQHMVEALQQTMDAIPAEIIAIYNEPKSERKETIAIE